MDTESWERLGWKICSTFHNAQGNAEQVSGCLVYNYTTYQLSVCTPHGTKFTIDNNVPARLHKIVIRAFLPRTQPLRVSPAGPGIDPAALQFICVEKTIDANQLCKGKDKAYIVCTPDNRVISIKPLNGRTREDKQYQHKIHNVSMVEAYGKEFVQESLDNYRSSLFSISDIIIANDPDMDIKRSLYIGSGRFIYKVQLMRDSSKEAFIQVAKVDPHTKQITQPLFETDDKEVFKKFNKSGGKVYKVKNIIEGDQFINEIFISDNRDVLETTLREQSDKVYTEEEFSATVEDRKRQHDDVIYGKEKLIQKLETKVSRLSKTDVVEELKYRHKVIKRKLENEIDDLKEKIRTLEKEEVLKLKEKEESIRLKKIKYEEKQQKQEEDLRKEKQKTEEKVNKSKMTNASINLAKTVVVALASVFTIVVTLYEKIKKRKKQSQKIH
ncbi:MAG: hypothetical protein GY804_09500 [Alphaproteobacteria bacterium]|nr:hypothetical protein [Alphaproteobacteria bacterium]